MGRCTPIALVVAVFTLAALPASAQTVPTAPTGLTAQVIGSTVTLSWNAAFGDPTGYLVEAGSRPGLSNLGQLPIAGATTTLAVPGVPPGNYFVRVRAGNVFGSSSASADVVVGVGATCQLPAAPSGLTVDVNGPGVGLQWSGTAPFRLEAGTAPGGSNVFAGDIGGANTLGAVVPPGAYYIRVHALSSCGVSLASNEVLAAVQVPAPPTGFASSVIGAEVTLQWTAPSSGITPTSYRLEAGTAPGLSNITTIALVASPTRLVVSNVPAGTYYVRLRSGSGTSFGAATPDLAFTVGAPPTGTTTITFNGLGPVGTPFTTLTEQGLVVENVSGAWQSSGSPNGLSIIFIRQMAGPDITGEIKVTREGGVPFTFSSARLYSSVTMIPYVFRGERGGVTVFTAGGTVPNTFGNYATVANPFFDQIVDAVFITATNPGIGGLASNPVGIDDIVVWPR